MLNLWRWSICQVEINHAPIKLYCCQEILKYYLLQCFLKGLNKRKVQQSCAGIVVFMRLLIPYHAQKLVRVVNGCVHLTVTYHQFYHQRLNMNARIYRQQSIIHPSTILVDSWYNCHSSTSMLKNLICEVLKSFNSYTQVKYEHDTVQVARSELNNVLFPLLLIVSNSAILLNVYPLFVGYSQCQLHLASL